MLARFLTLITLENSLSSQILTPYRHLHIHCQTRWDMTTWCAQKYRILGSQQMYGYQQISLSSLPIGAFPFVPTITITGSSIPYENTSEKHQSIFSNQWNSPPLLWQKYLICLQPWKHLGYNKLDLEVKNTTINQ